MSDETKITPEQQARINATSDMLQKHGTLIAEKVAQNPIYVKALIFVAFFVPLCLIAGGSLMMTLINDSHNDDYLSNMRTFSIILMAVACGFLIASITIVALAARKRMKNPGGSTMGKDHYKEMVKVVLSVITIFLSSIVVANGAIMYQLANNPSDHFALHAGEYAGVFLGVGITSCLVSTTMLGAYYAGNRYLKKNDMLPPTPQVSTSA